MNDRDQLAALIRSVTSPDKWEYTDEWDPETGAHSRYPTQRPAQTPEEIADAILAAGWRAPGPTTWACGHKIEVGNRGHDGECIPCTLARWAAGETTWNQ